MIAEIQALHRDMGSFIDAQELVVLIVATWGLDNDFSVYYIVMLA